MFLHEIIRLAQETFDKARVAENALPFGSEYNLTRDNLWDIMSSCLTIQRLAYAGQTAALAGYGIKVSDPAN